MRVGRCYLHPISGLWGYDCDWNVVVYTVQDASYPIIFHPVQKLPFQVNCGDIEHHAFEPKDHEESL